MYVLEYVIVPAAFMSARSKSHCHCSEKPVMCEKIDASVGGGMVFRRIVSFVLIYDMRERGKSRFFSISTIGESVIDATVTSRSYVTF